MDYTTISDIDLVGLLQNEDEEAFVEIYNRYWKRVYFLAFKYTKSEEASKDIAQDVFLKLWINRNNLNNIRDFKPFLFVSARNLIISSLRNKVFHVELDEDEILKEDTLLPDKQLSYKESLGLLNEAIEQLPPQQKIAYRLSRNDGKKYEEIAAEMGISISTVKIHVSKAIGFVRNYLINNSVHKAILILIILGRK